MDNIQEEWKQVEDEFDTIKKKSHKFNYIPNEVRDIHGFKELSEDKKDLVLLISFYLNKYNENTNFKIRYYNIILNSVESLLRLYDTGSSQNGYTFNENKKGFLFKFIDYLKISGIYKGSTK